jgi:hypothetical protein
MTRAAIFTALLTGVLGGASRADDVEVAPPPRPAGVPFQPPAASPKAEDPAETVGKIIKNSKDVTDKLAKSDTSTGTRKTQDETLALIDSLINRQEDPPPDGDKNDDKDKKDKSDSKDKDDQKQKGDGQPNGKDGKGERKEKDGKSESKGGGMGGGMGQPKSGRRPRSEGGKEPGGKQQSQPGGQGGGTEMGNTAPGANQAPNGKTPNRGDTGKFEDGKPKPTLPVDDDVAKDVWGHLPDKLRQQVTQYYKEEFMPRYADLLRQYYSSLSEKGAKPVEKK